MVVITNKKSPHFNKVGRVQERLVDEGKVLVYIESDEAIYEFSDKDISSKKKNQSIPKTRKKFYEFIQNENNSREDIVALINDMMKKKVLKLNSQTNFLNPYILNSNHSVGDIVQQIRMWRDEGKIAFLKHLSKKSRYSNAMHYSK